MPSPDVVKRALNAIKRGADYEYFFSRIQSPDWITPLSDAGLFRTPPTLMREGEYVRFPIWAESRYLVRMAPKAPQLVAAILFRVPPTENVRVYEDIAEAALAMPAHLSARLVPKIKEGLESRYQLLLPHKLGALLSHLAAGGRVAEALDLARHLLMIVPGAEIEAARDEFAFPPEPHARIRLTDYEEILKDQMPKLVETGGRQAVELLCDLLESAVAASTRGTRPSGEDYSHVWRPSVETEERIGGADVKNLLVSAARDAAERLVRSHAGTVREVVAAIESRPWRIFRRIALHLLMRFPCEASDLISLRLADRALFDDRTVWHEYALLTEERFGDLGEDAKGAILQWIGQGPAVDDEAKQRLSSEELKSLVGRWQLVHLWSIRHHLPPDWRLRYDELTAEFGEPEHPEFPIFRTTTWVGPTSPKTADELRQMSSEGILRFFRGWQPPQDPMGPSPEGLGRVLTEVVASQPERFAEGAELFRDLDPTYVGGLISGLRDALGQDRGFPWQVVLSLCLWIVQQPREIPGRGGRYADLDPGWVWTRQSVADLLSAGLEKRPGELPFDLRSSVWGILRPLMDDPDPTPDREAKLGDTDMDPATLSINTVRGEAMHAAVRYGLWVRRYQAAQPDAQQRIAQGFEEIPELRAILDAHLDSTVDVSRAIRSVYGQWFPWLVLLDRGWATANVARIFPQSPDQTGLYKAAWETYVSFCAPYDDAFDILQSVYARAVAECSKEGKDQSRRLRDSERSLAEHLMAFYWRGKLELDSPAGLLPRFFGNARVDLRGHAIEFVGRSLQGTVREQVSDRTRERLRALWERRLSTVEANTDRAALGRELQGFGWWFVSGQFDEEWALEQLRRLLHLPIRLDPEHMVVERLASLVDRYPTLTVECLGLIVEHIKENWAVDAWRGEARLLLSRGLRSPDPRAREGAERVIHLLGARGYFEFRDLLSSAERS